MGCQLDWVILEVSYNLNDFTILRRSPPLKSCSCSGAPSLGCFCLRWPHRDRAETTKQRHLYSFSTPAHTINCCWQINCNGKIFLHTAWSSFEHLTVLHHWCKHGGPTDHKHHHTHHQLGTHSFLGAKLGDWHLDWATRKNQQCCSTPHVAMLSSRIQLIFPSPSQKLCQLFSPQGSLLSGPRPMSQTALSHSHPGWELWVLRQ